MLLSSWLNKAAELSTVGMTGWLFRGAPYWFPVEFSIPARGSLGLRHFYLEGLWLFSNSCFSGLRASRVPRGVYPQGALLSFSCANTKVINVPNINKWGHAPWAGRASPPCPGPRTPHTNTLVTLTAKNKNQIQLHQNNPFIGKLSVLCAFLCRVVSSA